MGGGSLLPLAKVLDPAFHTEHDQHIVDDRGVARFATIYYFTDGSTLAASGRGKAQRLLLDYTTL
jgi:hypothetical protein